MCSVRGRSRFSQIFKALFKSLVSFNATDKPRPFIIACPAPCPKYGGMACAASPRIAIFPSDQRFKRIVLN